MRNFDAPGFAGDPFGPRDGRKRNEGRDPFGRVPPKPMPEPEISNLGDASKLARPVGEQGRNDRRDVAKVETMLGRAGSLDLEKTDGPTGYWGERTREATRMFQKQNGLKVDGQINPNGETIRTLAKLTGKAGGHRETGSGDVGRRSRKDDQGDVKVALGPGALTLPLLFGGSVVAGAIGEQLRRQHGRTDTAPKLPDREEFPTHQPDPKDGIFKGRPAEPQAPLRTPPLTPPDTGEFHEPLVTPDQSDDPMINGPQILEFKELPEPVEFAKGGKPPEETQKALDALDPATAQLVKEAGLSDGTATHGNAKGMHIETGKPESQRDADFRAMVRKFGDDPDGARVEHVGPGRLKYESPTGVIIMSRPSDGNGLTLEIQVPSVHPEYKTHQIKRRYGEES
ncbi:MAG: peptidoglycan-binding protein [Rhodospirillales bacterium]|nr:peptidoglycan-binding protein [Rhodospirillales bacterium]MBO6787519.1 peptidoglycan-binding protein [Rhodospirillales bacterium]